MPMKSTSRRRTAEGELVQIRLRDRHRLIALRTSRPDEKGRAGLSLTQRQAAAHVGISHGHYGDIEAGRRHPSLAVGERLAAFFSVPLDHLCEVRPIVPARAGRGPAVPPADGAVAEVADEGSGGHRDEPPVGGGGDRHERR